MSDRDRIAAVIAYCETQAALSWRDGMTADEAHGRNAVAEEVLRLIAAGVTMPTPPKGETDRALCWCGESAESTGWGVCEKHFDVDRCNKPQGDPGRFCILNSGHYGRCI